MYFEEFTATGALTAEIAEDLAEAAGRYSSYITVTSNGYSVQAFILPVCWEELAVAAGSTVTVTAERGYRPLGDEDRVALWGFVRRFQLLTASESQRLPIIRGTCASAPRRRRW